MPHTGNFDLHKYAHHMLTLLLFGLLSGCASVHEPPAAGYTTQESDPYERFNRSMYAFNDALDRAVMKPVAEGYQKIAPKPVNTGITNFFSNLDDFVVLFNDLLQLKWQQAGMDFSRITWNSTVGILGLIDVATPMNLPKHNEDFGQTLGHWGVGSGPYLVLPIIGPSSLRDGPSLLVDWQIDPLVGIGDPDESTRWGLLAVKYIDIRADLLRASTVLEQAALDEYIFLRESYRQRRENLVYDGNPPLPAFDPYSDELPFDTPPPQ